MHENHETQSKQDSIKTKWGEQKNAIGSLMFLKNAQETDFSNLFQPPPLLLLLLDAFLPLGQ